MSCGAEHLELNYVEAQIAFDILQDTYILSVDRLGRENLPLKAIVAKFYKYLCSIDDVYAACGEDECEYECEDEADCRFKDINMTRFD